MKKIRVICIYTGRHSIKNIVPEFDKSSDYNLVGIHVRSNETLKLIKNKYTCKITNKLDELVNFSNYEMVYISSVPSLHYPLSKFFLNKNKHVLVEKPAVINSNQASRLTNLAKKNKLVLMEGFMYRFHKQFKKISNLLDKEKIEFIEATFGFPHLNKNDFRYDKKLGGGALLDAGCYTISIIHNIIQDDMKLVSYKFQNIESEVDTKGSANFITKNNAKCRAIWYFGGKYKNELKIETKNKKFFIERVFSKPADLVTNIKVISKDEKILNINVSNDNHFKRMILHFHNGIFNSKIRDEECSLIKNQSKYINVLRKKLKNIK